MKLSFMALKISNTVTQFMLHENDQRDAHLLSLIYSNRII